MRSRTCSLQLSRLLQHRRQQHPVTLALHYSYNIITPCQCIGYIVEALDALQLVDTHNVLEHYKEDNTQLSK